MTFKADITNKITTDFDANATRALEILENAIAKTDYLETDRVIRCIIFLAKGNMDDLNKYIKAAAIDPRDVMLWAEYEKSNDDADYKRLRDFDHSFEEKTN